MPWVWYAPTLKGLPGSVEEWMFERFLAAGIAIAGIDVGESYGSPSGRASYQALYAELTTKRGYGEKPALLARSRGGLMLYNWAVEHPESVGGIAGIYPVCNLASYPGTTRAAPAYGMDPEELEARLAEHNPIDRLAPLAMAEVPILHIHGDADKVVPLSANSEELGKRYAALGGPVEILVMEGRGHDLWSGWFQSRELTDFAISRALGQASNSTAPGQLAKRLELPGLVVDLRNRHVDLDGTICLAEGLLELVACTRGTKEHESIVALDATPVHIHTALLLLGAESGNPAMRKRVDEKQDRWVDVPPRGGAVDVYLVVENEKGKLVERPISDFIRRSRDRSAGKASARFPTHTFLFAGSHLVDRGPGPRIYACDVTGNVISIATFGDELLCLSGIHDQSDAYLLWEVDATNLPAFGSKVTLRLRPQLRPTKRADGKKKSGESTHPPTCAGRNGDRGRESSFGQGQSRPPPAYIASAKALPICAMILPLPM
jgi:hypothetical protein